MPRRTNSGARRTRGEATSSRAGVLRVGTFNVRGLLQRQKPSKKPMAKKCFQLAKLWRRMQLDVVLLQETHVSQRQQAEADTTLRFIAQTLLTGVWTAFWAHAGDNPCTGVAVLIRTALINSGAVSVSEAAVVRDAGGRLVAVPVRWGGHRLQLVSAYLPSGDPAGQRTFITQHLQPLMDAADAPAQSRRMQVWGGDFNFVEDPQRDRLPAPAGSHPDSVTARHLHAQCTGMVDQWRRLHPTSATFTYNQQAAAGEAGISYSRLDRFYTSAALSDYVTKCDVQHPTTSDHRPVTLTLVAQQPSTMGPGLHVYSDTFKLFTDLHDKLKEWLRPRLTAAPMDVAELLIWWPAFKRALAHQLKAVNATAKERLQSESEAVKAALGRMQAAQTAADAAPQSAVLKRQLAGAQKEYMAAVVQSSADDSASARCSWLHIGERPNPVLTRLLKPPKAAKRVAAVRAPAGALVEDPRRISDCVARYWAGISAAPQQDSAATAAVLAPLQAAAAAGDGCIPDAVAGTLGAEAVSEEEVLVAMKGTKPGKSPGVDGITADVYRTLKHCMAPVLARVYSAIGSTHTMPRGFTLGAIVTLHKKGDRTEAGNYRPISLLNADYRLLAKVLANRLKAALDPVIAPEQSAFLTGRDIGDNILTQQCTHRVLKRERRRAVVAMLDFYKAYDTISRPFLFEVMRIMGAGDSFLAWTQLLLSDTRAVAVVNGHRSAPVPFEAGVRQGCPLSPLLYLFIGQALLVWLKHRAATAGVGVEVDGEQLVAVQHADDTAVFLLSLASWSAFAAEMHTFGCASGQRLNWTKVELLPIGADPPPGDTAAAVAAVAAAAVAVATASTHARNARFAQKRSRHRRHRTRGAQGTSPPQRQQQQQQHVIPDASSLVVEKSTALGIVFSRDPAAAAVDWDSRIAGIQRMLGQVKTMYNLSAFGRAFAVAGYCISTAMYHAEHGGLPSTAAMQALTADTARLIDGREPRAGRHRPSITGFSKRMMVGHPTEGGLGALDLDMHTRARWAKRGMQLANSGAIPADQRPLWMRVARVLLVGSGSSAPVRYLSMQLDTFTLWAECGSSDAAAATDTATADPIQRMRIGLRSLPALSLIGGTPAAGAWCAALPLWNNAFITAALGSRFESIPDTDILTFTYPVPTLGELARWHLVAQHFDAWNERTSAGWRKFLDHVFKYRAGGRDVLEGYRERVHDALLAALLFFPPSWREAAMDAVELTYLQTAAPFYPAALEEEAQQVMVAALGWPEQPHQRRTHAQPPAATQQQQQQQQQNDEAPATQQQQQQAAVPPHIAADGLTVSEAYNMQLQPIREERMQRQAAYVAEALNGADVAELTPLLQAPQQAALHLQGMLANAWSIRWENSHKETLWRLSINACHHIGNGATQHTQQQQTYQCHCAAATPCSRAHHYHECEVAAAVFSAIQAAIPGCPPLQRHHIWLAHPPVQRMHKEIWLVVCMAALECIEHGRKYLVREHRRRQEQQRSRQQGGMQQTQLTDFYSLLTPPPAQLTPAQVAAESAVTQFWRTLENFACIALSTQSSDREERWKRQIQQDHPLLALTADGGFRVNRPAAAV